MGAKDSNGRDKILVGYDVCSYLKIWQQKQGLQHLSVCEILTVERFKMLRRCVGISNVFWSHIQQEGVLSVGSTFSLLHAAGMMYASRLPPADATYFWLDYCSLRQCVPK